MLQSQLFGRTNKESKEYDSKNATLLIKAGFINQTMSGVYSYLPLGLKVLQKIEGIIREEMNKVGQEVFLPAIVPTELWEKTNRLDSVSVLFKAVPGNNLSKKTNDAQYVLNSTHEEVITPIAKSFNFSYKDLPFAVYQIQTKFRNEARPKSGLMRGREFRMKDLYSFHADEKDLKRYYEEVKGTYARIFDRLGIGQDTVVVAASGGDFTKDFSHEFQTRCETGEDLIFYSKKTGLAFNKEIAPSKASEFKQSEKEELMKEVKGKGLIGVEELSKFLKIEVKKTTKTIIYKADNKDIIAAVVRGDYDINEEKLIKIAGVKSVELADEKTIKEVTGAEVGYAGVLNLPKSVRVFFDESTDSRINFEMGANKTDHHTININWDRDIEKPKEFYDIKVAKQGDLDPETGQPYEYFQASEVGNIFPLNTKFSKAFDYYYTDESGEKKIVYMGSYGIGSSRVMGVLVEKFNDEKGIIWPDSVAPFKAHLIKIGRDDKVVKEAEKLYNDLLGNGIEVLYDDRQDVSVGVKFNEADLIGIPYRLVISDKTKGKIEIKRRDAKEAKIVSAKEVIKILTKD